METNGFKLSWKGRYFSYDTGYPFSELAQRKPSVFYNRKAVEELIDLLNKKFNIPKEELTIEEI